MVAEEEQEQEEEDEEQQQQQSIEFLNRAAFSETVGVKFWFPKQKIGSKWLPKSQTRLRKNQKKIRTGKVD